LVRATGPIGRGAAGNVGTYGPYGLMVCGAFLPCLCPTGPPLWNISGPNCLTTGPPSALLSALCKESTASGPPAASTAFALNTYSPSESIAGIESDVLVPGPDTFPPSYKAGVFGAGPIQIGVPPVVFCLYLCPSTIKVSPG